MDCIEGNGLFSGEGGGAFAHAERRPTASSFRQSSRTPAVKPARLPVSHTRRFNLSWFPRPIPLHTHKVFSSCLHLNLLRSRPRARVAQHHICFPHCDSGFFLPPFNATGLVWATQTWSFYSLRLRFTCTPFPPPPPTLVFGTTFIKMHAVPSLHFLWRTCLATYLK